MARNDPQLKLRLTEELKDKIVEAAKANGRSVNSEIAYRLEESLLFEEMQQEAFAPLSDDYIKRELDWQPVDGDQPITRSEHLAITGVMLDQHFQQFGAEMITQIKKLLEKK
ncbi:Arc family DNA-binding protein [Martelella mediterranea]|uniref:Mnt n=1 Tax=Martelella mediterranea DSM 17316 TaxID=1122214 RepID=A0A1U9YYP7_9HYPH|nr:Arc family DNA-binding protein [Martelella mediterranea]AQZ50548.1 Mnt [Martelella mediterranea DSM 17316]